jgi:hypothetical protein
MDTRPTTAHHDALTGITEIREMTEAEYAQHLADIDRIAEEGTDETPSPA